MAMRAVCREIWDMSRVICRIGSIGSIGSSIRIIGRGIRNTADITKYDISISSSIVCDNINKRISSIRRRISITTYFKYILVSLSSVII